MKRLPALLSLLLFLALCASLAYWLLQWLAPPQRPVTAAPVATRSMPPLMAATNLFGGNGQGSSLANVQLRGVIRSGLAAGSVAIISAEGKPARALRVHAEVLPGIQVKEIHARTVILSDKGAERELALPSFVAQAGGLPETAPANAPVQGVMQGTAQGTTQGTLQQAPAGTPPAPNLPPAVQGVGGSGTTGAGAAGASGASGGESAAPASAQAPRPEMRTEMKTDNQRR